MTIHHDLTPAAAWALFRVGVGLLVLHHALRAGLRLILPPPRSRRP